MKKLPQEFGAVVGDEIFFHHEEAPCCGRVLSVGKHGVTVDQEGKRHRVTWERVLGHKKRVLQKLKIVHEGEDGMIVEDSIGKKRYVRIPLEAKEGRYMVKSLADRQILLFTKSEKIANRAGLHLENRTDRTGRNQKKWVRTNPDQSGSGKRSKVKDPDPHDRRGSSVGYGIHNIEGGDRIHFKLGELAGEGEVVGDLGKDGAHVKDSSGHIHQVRWDQITGHKARPDTKKPEHESPVLGKQEPVHPDNFIATEYAKNHDKADVTPEEILSNFPDDTT
ncbi:hypothetical protein, partial [Nitrosomonas sp.]|uniref:hypothetical protein n=1 Tax=Nitrosomonas sp. TaxID=42353 RepID=UPI0026194429